MADFDKKARQWDADPVKIERAHTVAEAIRKQVPCRQTDPLFLMVAEKG